MANLKLKDGVTLSGTNDATREVLNSFAQIGMVLPYLAPITQTSSAGTITTTAPNGWLLCNGNSFLQADYPQLYAVLGSTTLPNLSSKHIVGTTTSSQVGTSYGNNVHVHFIEGTSTPTVSSVSASSHEAASGTVTTGASATNHDHANTSSANIDYYSPGTYVNYVVGSQANVHLRTHTHNLSASSTSGATNDNHGHTITRDASTLGVSNSHTHTTTIGGSTTADSTSIPTVFVSYIIKADK